MKTCQSIFFLILFYQSAHASPEFRGYISKIKNDHVSVNALKNLASLGVTVQSEIPQLHLIVTKEDPRKIVSHAASWFDYVEPNYVIRVSGDSGSKMNQSQSLWGMRAIHADEAWSITRGKKDVIVAVSDTGNFDHFDLKDNFWLNPGENGVDAKGKDKSKNKIDDDGNGYIDDYRGWNFETNSNDPDDDHYHGTHVSGTIGATGKGLVNGVAWNVSIMTAKFIGRDGSGTDDAGARTIVYAADNGAKAVNCSWGGEGQSQAIHDAIVYAKSKGMLVVVAAGNDDVDIDKYPTFPASDDAENIISVGATDDAKHRMASFSNWGLKGVDLVAPGESILSTFNPMALQLHQVWYEYLDGTSMAAPHVTGTVALIYSINPKLSWKQVKEIILSSVTKVPALSSKVLTGGALNTLAAVKAAQASIPE